MAETKITDQSLVPMTWVFLVFGFTASTTIIGAFWVAAVNFRLQRIEEKLGIPAYHVTLSPIENANAGGKYHVDDEQRLFEFIQFMQSHK